jgi:tyrosinase
MAIRKDANTLSNAERIEFTNAILELKSSGIYNQFVLRHANANASAIHRSPAFLPWHRRFIWDFEKQLQRVSGNSQLGLPYWNWAEGGMNASMWNDSLLGGDGDPVTGIVNHGPFKAGQWTVITSSNQPAGPLIRALGRTPFPIDVPILPTLADIQQVLSVTPYDEAPWNTSVDQSFRNALEGFLHNRGHRWVGGSMLAMTSPNDPVFFMHHCMVDKLWYEWQLRFPRQSYLPSRNGPLGQNLNDTMDSTPTTPPGSHPADVLDSSALDIEYDQLLIGTPPPSNSDPILLAVNTAALDARIATPGEQDSYYFDVGEFNRFTIETSGASDTVMTLFGPDSPSSERAFDDDGGDDLSSKITQSLPTGKYYVTVRLYDPAATGDYQIALSSENNALIPKIQVNGIALNEDITDPREIDLFRFSAQNQGLYTIETTGNTDTFMNLFGPDSQTQAIAENDDGGVATNSRLQVQLAAGEYFVIIRHYSQTGVGAYQIRVTS